MFSLQMRFHGYSRRPPTVRKPAAGFFQARGNPFAQFPGIPGFGKTMLMLAQITPWTSNTGTARK